MRSIICLFAVLIAFAPVSFAQVPMSEQAQLFGNVQQPGYKLHTAVVILMGDGEPLETASALTLNNALGDGATMLSPRSRSAILTDSDISLTFVQKMVGTNSLIETTKTTIESFPENALVVVALAVSLYPDFAQEIIDTAALTGEIDPNDALLAALTAGADPTTVSVATAAGAGAVAIAAAPLGAGIGAGGTGGGDTTASTN